ncbi:MAG: rhamnan synthesis F family protein [Kiritimatiellae bacterium]|nr:rhamnan synthesis F family protein [Kiritimatiellia bacterium]
MCGCIGYALDIVRALKRTLIAARKTAKAELKIARDTRTIRESPLFDPQWYLKNNPDVAASGLDPARHYLLFGVGSNRNPSLSFVNEEYWALHHDVRTAKLNPLLHYERFGRREGRQISLTEVKEPVFPDGAEECTVSFGRFPRVHGRTAIVASYFGKGVIPETLVYLLKGLKKVSDNIILVADCPVFPGETEKLRGIVSVAKFLRHGQYDFGSYRRGLEIAREEGLAGAEVADELVVMNDSSYGPVYPFAETFGTMAGRDCDFWGMTPYRAIGGLHLQSYFYVFRRPVIDGGKLDEFLSRVEGRFERDKVIVLFELRLTEFLTDAGYRWDSYVPLDVLASGSPTKNPLTLCGKYRMPLLKVKAVDGDSNEPIGKVLSLVRKVNPELASMIKPKTLARTHEKVSYEKHQASFPEKCRRLAAKISAGGKAKTVFFVSSSSMFPARPLFDAMMRDGMFDPRIVVIPDLRWHDGGHLDAMESCRADLATTVPEERLSVAQMDEFGQWIDVLECADIVCYPSPYEMSSFRYNPRYAVGRDFLPIHVNYGYYRSVYDRHVMGGQSYAYMWKAFFECEDTLAEYRANSAIGGVNGELVGYVKMDALAAARKNAHPRKRILVAPHHSVEGGTNKMLSLANFIRYADFFMSMPDRWPGIDFVFRPHPFLFKIMSRPKIWGPGRVERYVRELKSKPNVIWSDGGDYFSEFAESDGCIQDCGSYLVEYMYTGKPCCYMLKSPADIDVKFAPLGRKCLEQCYIAYDTDAIDSFIRDVIVGGNDSKAKSRAAFAKTIMVNHPHAAEAALACIKRSAGL